MGLVMGGGMDVSPWAAGFSITTVYLLMLPYAAEMSTLQSRNIQAEWFKGPFWSVFTCLQRGWHIK